MGTVVLFNHPGQEHEPRQSGQVFPWNTGGGHRRKYVSVLAQLARSDEDANRLDPAWQRVSLWGEYEAPTMAHRFDEPPELGMPDWWHTLLPVGTAPVGAQNTDPWVFGSTFRYVYCRQTAKATAYLKHLTHGDLLLFGSYKEHLPVRKSGKTYDFYLDTVFVVDQPNYPSERTERPRSLYDAAHLRATYNRLPWDERDGTTFYTGVMLGRQRSKLPFCFSPCTLAQGEIPGRARRPMISDLFGGPSNTPQFVEKRAEKSTADAWRKVVDRCLEQGLGLAARIEDATIDPGRPDGGAAGGDCD